MIKLGSAGITLVTLLLLITFSANDCLAQFTDNFSDGEFELSPSWAADAASNWIVENEQLRSNSMTASSTFYISTVSSTATNAQWEFLVNLKFNTSGANFVDVFLVSNQSDLSGASVSGYFVRLGGTPDEVSLYRMDSGLATILIDGTNGTTASSNNLIRVKVTRSESNDWTLMIAPLGDTVFQLEGMANDNTYQISQYFGIRITQSTSSFFGKHYFDDFYVGDIIVDKSPPTLLSAKTVNSNEVELSFDEELQQVRAEDNSNYMVDNSIGQPVLATLRPDQKSIRLQFAKAFSNLQTYTITVSGVEDLSGNTITSDQKSFDYYEFIPAISKSIIITEVFADPSPVIGLPEGEFVEIYNRSDHVFDMKDWQLTDGSSYAILPSFLLFPGEYAIITASSLVASFLGFGDVIGIANFPTLNNSSDRVTIISPEQVTIDVVSYDDSWYADDDKKQGGWALELIDLESTCADSENWIASESEIGGTPGAVNSVNSSKPDLTGPKLVSGIPISDTMIKLSFNEKLNTETPLPESISMMDGVISQIEFVEGSLRELLITVNPPLNPDKTYTITVTNIYDCPGNEIQPGHNSAVFGLPGNVEVGDVVINEILFNPKPFGVDFVELYNTSNKFLNINSWNVGNYTEGNVVNSKLIINTDHLIFPNSYFVITTDALTLKSHYPNGMSDNFISVAALPSFNDDEGTVAISAGNAILDHFSYTREFHSTLLKDDEGVSLERISTTTDTNSKENWQSASSVAGFATPGFMNSNSRSDAISSATFVVEPEVFQPVVGQPAFTQIIYRLDKAGMSANIKVLDQQGRIIKEIANNELLGSEGFFRWDGDTDSGGKARVGYYLVLAELFDVDGRVFAYKKRVVIAPTL